MCENNTKTEMLLEMSFFFTAHNEKMKTIFLYECNIRLVASYIQIHIFVAAVCFFPHIFSSSFLFFAFHITCSFPTRRLNHPICFSSPIILDNARFASSKARCVLRAIAECNALNQTNASCGSLARNKHECTPSGE